MNNINKWKTITFSANNIASEKYRQQLENRYIEITEVTDKFNRQSVSYQLSKQQQVNSWLKYKEGFSSHLVEQLLEEMKLKMGDTILDPFIGSGTTFLAAQKHKINSIGFDILPISTLIINVKKNIYKYDVEEIFEMINLILASERPKKYSKKTNYINITKGAYPLNTEKDITYFTVLIETSNFSHITISLAKLCLLNSLEIISYTKKDGQYLRWDERSTKVINTNKKRLENGKEPLKVILNKGDIPTVKQCLVSELQKILTDISNIQKHSNLTSSHANLYYKENSALFELPLLQDNSINGVITSPPYCNRYDYTRTYALELSYLGLNDNDVKMLRQELLSCTVENKTKIMRLKEFYSTMNKVDDFNNIIHILEDTSALNEIIEALTIRKNNGEINNNGIINMVKLYFQELTFIFYELYRISKPGSKIFFINDNVRYAGEVIPVDFISTYLAEKIGFKPLKIYTLKQQKGNSSQQMKKYGRVALRKSITVWEK